MHTTFAAAAQLFHAFIRSRPAGAITVLLAWLGIATATALAGTITYDYDELGRLKRVIHEDGRQTVYTLDAAGNRVAFTTTPPPGFLQFSSATYSVAENVASLTITVSRVGGSYGAATVSYSTANATATAGSDYTAASGTLSWIDGETAPKTFAIPVLDDAALEGDETLALALTGVTGASLGTPAAATVAITDYEAGTLQLSPSSYSIAENGGSVTVTVTRTSGTDGAVSVTYATSNGSATLGSDFTAASGTLNWAAGDFDAKTFAVTITDDTTVESSESFNLTLSGATGGAALGTATGTVTVTDFEPGELQFATTSYSVTEAATTVTVSVSRTAGSNGAVGVSYAATADTASSPADFTATSGTLNWANGDPATKTFAVTIADDTTGEAPEAINLALSSATGGALLGASSGTITINDNETGTLQFSAANSSVAEAAGTATINVTRVNGSYGAASVNYGTANGTASAGSDFTFSSGILNWTNGESAPKSFTVPITSDSSYESPNETFTAVLTGATGSTLVSPSSTTITITDDDPAVPGTLALGPATYTVLEGATTVTVTVTRTGGTDLAVSVQYATSAGTATAGPDYLNASGALNWSHGDGAPKTFAVTIQEDSFSESAETINLALSNVTGGATLDTSPGTITINDNEAGVLHLSPATYSLSENIGSFTVTVARVSGSYGAVTVDYATVSGTATAGSDFTSTSGTLSWANGDTSNRTFNVSIIDDAISDPSEQFDIRLTNATGGASAYYQSNNVTIVDNESAVPGPPTISGGSLVRDQGQSYTISWSSVSGATGYELWESANGGAFIRVYSGAGTSKLFTNATAGEYDYRAKACNASGCSLYSNNKHVDVCAGACQ